MHEPELPVNKIIVQAQALTAGIEQTGSTFSIGKPEALACFHSRQDTDETMFDSILFGNLPGFFFLPDPAVEVDVRSPALFSHGLGVFFDLLRVLGDKSLEILEQKASGRYESIHVFCPADRQISFEQKSVKTGYRSGDFLCMVIDKFLHGVLPYVG